MYDQTALDGAWDLVKDWDTETREGLRVAASEQALQGVAGKVRMADLARDVLALSEAGLKARGHDEARFLAPLHEEVASGRVMADVLLDHYNGDWNGDLTKAYDVCRY